MAAELPDPGAATASRGGGEPAGGGGGRAETSAQAAVEHELGTAADLGSGPAVRARQAASVIVVRQPQSGGELELLLVKRNPQARFMGGVWVFPGGAVDAGEGLGDRSHRAAAVRELYEEAGVGGVAPDTLVKFSRWITPAELAVRFDTHFFVAGLPPGQVPQVDGQECVEHAWLTARAALHAHRDGRMLLVFPTIRQLEQLRGFTRLDALIEHARGRAVTAVRPRVVFSGESARVVMPGEPGFDQPAAAAEPDPGPPGRPCGSSSGE